MTNTLAIILIPILGGWAVRLTDGRELARFRGPGAHFRALRYLHTQLAPGPAHGWGAVSTDNARR